MWYVAHSCLPCAQKIFWQVDAVTTSRFPSLKRFSNSNSGALSTLRPLLFLLPPWHHWGDRAFAIALTIIFPSLKGNYYSLSSFIHTASWRQCSGSPPCFFINNNPIGASLCSDAWVRIVFWRDDPTIKQQSLRQSATRNQAATQPFSFGKVSEDLLPVPFQTHMGLPELGCKANLKESLESKELATWGYKY